MILLGILIYIALGVQLELRGGPMTSNPLETLNPYETMAAIGIAIRSLRIEPKPYQLLGL